MATKHENSKAALLAELSKSLENGKKLEDKLLACTQALDLADALTTVARANLSELLVKSGAESGSVIVLDGLPHTVVVRNTERDAEKPPKLNYSLRGAISKKMLSMYDFSKKNA